MICSHPERPNVLSLPTMGSPHVCRECWDKYAQPSIDAIQPRREPWDHAGYDHMSIGNTHYTRSTGGYLVYSCGDEPKGLK